LANGNGRDLIGWSVTDCEQAALIEKGALRVVYDSFINRTAPMITTYQREALTALYASLDYLTCNDLPGQAEIQAAIQAIEASAA
jgi:hypothetical protein